jgi:hypothetical protein
LGTHNVTVLCVPKTRAFGKQLRLLQRAGGTMDAAQMKDKFAGSTFEGAYGNLEGTLLASRSILGSRP